MPVGIDTAEIREVCDVYDTELTPALLMKVRHLDSAYRDAVVEDLNKKSRQNK